MSKREEINQKLNQLNISLNWIAQKLEIRPNTLSYLLESEDHFDDDLYDSISEAIESYQYQLKFLDDNVNEPNLFDENKLKDGIGARIRIFAKRKYTTLKALAQAMEISPQQLQQYISGNREPGSRILIKFLRLGCDINWLLGGSESLESYRIYKLELEIRNLQSKLSKISRIVEDSHEKHNK